ncbi:hypothetical protein IPdc08_01901 [archaeon]|nr:hypothetical protein IPdc08_01901 [archaeon]
MQKLLVEFKNTSWNPPQAPSSVSEVSPTVLANNISEKDQYSGKRGQVLSVLVVKMCEKPLIPTRPRKAKILFKQGKTTVIQRTPFTIKLNYPMEGNKQALVNTLKCDWTYGYITKYYRIKIGLKKSYVNGAFVIAGGTTQQRDKPYELALTRMNNRNSQPNRKGFKPSVRGKRYRLQPNDSVKYIKSLCKVKGVILMGKEYNFKRGEIGQSLHSL